MDNQAMLTKTIGLQRTAFTSGLSILSTMQQNAEALLKATLDQSPWLPAGGRTACLYAAECSSNYLGSLQSMAEQGFAELERISSLGVQQKEKKTQQTKATAKTTRPAAAAPMRPAVKKQAAAITKTATEKTVAIKTPPDQQLISHEKPPEQKQ